MGVINVCEVLNLKRCVFVLSAARQLEHCSRLGCPGASQDPGAPAAEHGQDLKNLA